MKPLIDQVNHKFTLVTADNVSAKRSNNVVKTKRGTHGFSSLHSPSAHKQLPQRLLSSQRHSQAAILACSAVLALSQRPSLLATFALLETYALLALSESLRTSRLLAVRRSLSDELTLGAHLTIVTQRLA